MNRRFFVSTLGALGASQLFPERVGAASFARTPYLQNVNSHRATVMLATFEPADCWIQPYTSEGFLNPVAADMRRLLATETRLPRTTYQFRADLTGLRPGTRYNYLVLIDGEDVTPAGTHAFTTPGDAGPVSFLVFGDSGFGSDGQRRIANRLRTEIADFVLHTGDIAYNSGTFDDFHSRHFSYYSSMMAQLPFFLTPGNHDYETPGALPYLTMHAHPAGNVPSVDRGRYYSFDWSNIHFVSLDSNQALEQAVGGGGGMLKWLDNDLRSTQKFWKIVYFHHPPYAAGPNERDVLSNAIRRFVTPILDQYGVQLVFSGHEHSYQRSHPIKGGVRTESGPATVYVTTGGGGAVLYPVFQSNLTVTGTSNFHYTRVRVNGLRLQIEAIDVDGRLIDQFSLAPSPAISNEAMVKGVSFIPTLTRGALVRIVGNNLAAEERYLCVGPLPTELTGTRVTINNFALNLFYVSNRQIFAQIPFDVGGNATLRVITPNGFVETAISASAGDP